MRGKTREGELGHKTKEKLSPWKWVGVGQEKVDRKGVAICIDVLILLEYCRRYLSGICSLYKHSINITDIKLHLRMK